MRKLGMVGIILMTAATLLAFVTWNALGQTAKLNPPPPEPYTKIDCGDEVVTMAGIGQAVVTKIAQGCTYHVHPHGIYFVVDGEQFESGLMAK